jgi:putative pyruvate formate lyase activating enzyme
LRQRVDVMPILNSKQICERAAEARKLSAPCRLCPRACGVDRTSGERGYCGAGSQASVAAVVPHFGEEPPLTTGGGAGTIFFTRCNMRCLFCQNHQISQGRAGATLESAELTAKILDLQQKGCSNIEPVSPTHHLPGFLKALGLAMERGLDLPVVYNSNGYESPHILDLLEGIVDIYLPDLKYASDAHAAKYSDADDYVETARNAILKMHSQVGNLVVDMKGRAVRGLILRHLILPGNVSGADETLAWIRENLPRSVTISLMAQYSPLHRGTQVPPLDRNITVDEYDRIVDLAWDMGLENVFVQDFEAQEVGIPDFNEKSPFSWD